MADTTSTTQFRADIAQLKSAMQAAQRSVRLASSEFNKAAAGLDDWSSSAVGLQAKIKQLDSTLAAQRRQVELANKEYEKTVQVYGKNSAEADRAKMKLNGYEAAVTKTEKQLKYYNDELKDCEEGTGRFADSTEDLEAATQKASDGFTVMKGALASLVADGIRIAISAVKDLAKETIQAGMDFESSMSQVGAISGATAEEMQQLTDKAKEMGAKTKFSASESAEAFNYMAMAGWKTEDMLNGIEGIMNLAAASGEDLATTSDIVTDALTAMGYSAGDAGKLADVMAAASSNANTNVALMGSTFQYAAPIVGALGYSMEDTAVAIGLMANAGIKGDKAGTALRSTLTRLSAPPKECADAMDALGLSITDSEGKMKPFSEVMEDLRGAFDGLSETQQTQYAKAIAGQEAMSGLLAIVNAAPADFEKLTKAVAESNGAAQEMSETMQDNLAGDITLIKSKIEGIMIKVFEKMSDSLRKSVDQMSGALDKIDWDAFGEKAGKMAEKLVDWLVKIIDNADGIIDVLKAVGTTLAVTFVIGKIASFATGIMGMVKTFQALKAATDIATTSQLLLNAAQAATPVGLVAAAVAGLAAGVIYLASKNKEAEITTTQLTDAETGQVDAINELNQAYKDMKATRDENVDSVNAEYGHYQDLAKELDGLVDANGAVKEADQERAAFIISTLNEALGTEIEMIDGIIQNYQDEKAALEDLMNTKKAEAVLRANEESYTTALKEEKDALANYMQAQELFTQKQNELNKAQQEAQNLANMTVEEYAKQNDMMWDLGTASNMLKNDQEAANEAVKNSTAALGEANVALHNAENAYTGYESTIANYEGLSAAIISGDQEKISEALSRQNYDFQTAETGTRETLENQVENLRTNYENMQKMVENHAPNVTQAMVDEAKEMYKQSKAELAKLPPETEKEAKKAGEASAKGLNSTKDTNKKAGQNIKKSAQTGAKDEGNEAQKIGKNLGRDYGEGVESQKDESKKAGKQLAQEAKKGADTKDSTTNSELSGSHFGEGFFNGIGKWFSKVFNRGKGLSQEATKGLKAGQKEGSPSKITYQSGVYFVQGYINGIASQQSKLQGTVKEMVAGVISILQNADAVDVSSAANNASAAYAEAIQKKFGYTFEKMQYQNEEKLKEFDTLVDQYTAAQEAAASSIQAKGDALVKEIENDRDRQVKAFEEDRDSQIKKIESERDSFIKQVEKEINELEKKINKTTDKNAKKRLQEQKKTLQEDISRRKTNTSKEISSIKESYKNKIDAEKNQATTAINAQKEITKKEAAASSENYNILIETEKANKEAYQTASSEMLTRYQAAMNEYQQQAQALIDDTINGITDRYNENYDALLNKQKTLISKLKSAGDLFNVSGAGIMTVNDLTEQTRQIKEYTSKLQQIKNKVSSELFDEIASFDVKEGGAYMDRLLKMSAAELEEYNKAYTEKMQAAEKAGEIYNKDFKTLYNNYQKELSQGFADLPKKLEELGIEAMRGFLEGLTSDTDYMSQEIKTYIQSMVDVFKNELQIHSPSRVMAAIGGYTGEGLIDGLKNTISDIKKTASTMAKAVSTPLDNITASADVLRASYGNYNGASGVRNTTVNNNYNLVQNNTSPKALTALETYTARRQQIAMIKALT